MPSGKSTYGQPDSAPNLQAYKTYVDGKLRLELAAIETIQAAKNALAKAGSEAQLNADIANAKQVSEELIAYKQQLLQSELRSDRYTVDERMRLEAEFQSFKQAEIRRLADEVETLEATRLIQRRLDEVALNDYLQTVTEQRLARMNIYERNAYEQKVVQESKAHQQALQNQREQYDLEYTLGTITDERKEEIERERLRLTQEINDLEASITERVSEQQELQEIINKAEELRLSNTELYQKHLQEIRTNNENIKQAETEILVRTELGLDTSDLEENIEAWREANDELIEHLSKERTASKQEVKQKDKEANTQMLREQMGLALFDKNASDEEKELAKEAIEQKKTEALLNGLQSLSSSLTDALNQIDENIDKFYAYQATVEARLQGSDESYKDSLKTISKNVGISGIISQKEVIENLKKLSDEGIAYNLDLRAFLATVSENIANTFDAFDANLLRLIRIQQADTTAARLGMEASLTKLFNRYFSDTSYLSNAFNNVAEAILDANANMNKNQSVAFEYMVQKWLGSLASLGVSDSTVSKMAEGLNYLGSGNIEALSSDESLMNLMSISATRAGISIGDILTQGLDSSSTNKLLRSMVEYLKSIAENSDNNNVMKSAYSNVFGISTTDLQGINNLSSTDIESLFNESLNYDQSMKELSSQLNQMIFRVHASQILDTMFDNAVLSASTAIGSNFVSYGTWKVLNLIEDLTGGIAIPAISVMGNMVDLHQTVTGLAKAGVAGLGLMGSLLGSLFSGSLFGTNNLSQWGFEEYTSRGTGKANLMSGVTSGFSESSELNNVGSASADDVKNSSMQDATDQSEEDSKITNQNVEDNGDIYEKIYAAIGDESTSVLKQIIKTNDLLDEDRIFKTELSAMAAIEDLLAPNRVFYASIIGMSPGDTNSISYTKSGMATYAGSNVSSINDLTNSSNLDLIRNLSASNAASSTTNTLITPHGMKVTLADLSPEVQAFILNSLKSMMTSALFDEMSNEGESGESFMTRIETLLNNLSVNVNNDFFDEVLQKAAFIS